MYKYFFIVLMSLLKKDADDVILKKEYLYSFIIKLS